MLEIFKELRKFSNVIFHEKDHHYFIDGKEAISSTTIIKKYEKPFDSEYWSARKAPELGMTPEEVAAMWEDQGTRASFKGTKVHSYIENALANKILPFEEQAGVMMENCGEIISAYDKIILMVDEFLNDIKDKMLPIRSEVIIGDSEHLIAGMVDQIFYNLKSKKLELWDWKTNKKIDEKTQYKLLKPLSHLSNSKLDIYSLQLSLYKYIIEKNTNLKLGNSYICWFNEKNSTYKIFKCENYEKYIKLMINDYCSRK